MKRINFTLFSLVGLFICYSCNKSNSIPYTQDGNWISRSSFNGPNRSEAVSFTIGNFAYVATGLDQNNKRYNDLWQYDPVADNWFQMASMPDSNRTGGDTKRSSAVGFSIPDVAKGYIGTGIQNLTYANMNDFWEYDPTANTWTQKADFAGSARYDAVGFGIKSLGYITTGYDGNNAQKDFWQYDPAADSWLAKNSMGGSKRSAAVAFVYNNKGYVVTGINSGTPVNDFWSFDPSSGTWTELRHITNFSSDNYDDGYTNIVRSNAAAFVITGTTSGDCAYVSTGENGTLYTYTWEYNFGTDLWKPKTPYEGVARTGAVGFNVQNRGYLGLGRSSTAVFDDLREFKPNDVYNQND